MTAAQDWMGPLRGGLQGPVRDVFFLEKNLNDCNGTLEEGIAGRRFLFRKEFELAAHML